MLWASCLQQNQRSSVNCAAEKCKLAVQFRRFCGFVAWHEKEREGQYAHIQPIPLTAGVSPRKIGRRDTPSNAQLDCDAGRSRLRTSRMVAMKSIVTTGCQTSRAGPLIMAGHEMIPGTRCPPSQTSLYVCVCVLCVSFFQPDEHVRRILRSSPVQESDEDTASDDDDDDDDDDVSDEQGIWIADGDERHAGVEVKWNNKYRESITLRPRSTPAEPGPAE